MCSKKLIAITGGIGSGKSVVSAILLNMSYPVYDCDYNAKRLMKISPIVKHDLTSCFGDDIYNADGNINNTLLSSIIFNNHDALTLVNSIVHPVVKDDIINWHNSCDKQLHFVETAILTEAGMHNMVDEVWNVVAPVETRIARVIRRNNTTRDKVMERINSQSISLKEVTVPVKNIDNDGNSAILPQIIKLLNDVKN